MKLNGWSIVKSPAGISLRPITDGTPDTPEVCIHILNGTLDISVHLAGFTDEIARLLVPLAPLKRLEELEWAEIEREMAAKGWAGVLP
jgi:hypothetical protein